MPQGLTITDEQRAQLPPDIVGLVDEYDQRYGVGNSVSHSLVSSYFEDQTEIAATPEIIPLREQLAPEASRQLGVSQAQINTAASEAIEVRAKEIALAESIDLTAARDKAQEEIGDVFDRFEGTTADARRNVRGYTEEDIVGAPSATRAFLRSMGTQSVQVGRAQRLQEQAGMDEQAVDALRDRVVIESKVKARQNARDAGLPEGTDAFDKFVERDFAKLAANELRLVYRDFYKAQKAHVLHENNLDPEGDYPEDMKDELLVEARERATGLYDMVTPLVFEGLGQVLGPNGEPLVPDAAPGAIRRLMEREREGGRSLWEKTRDTAALGFYSNWHQFDPGTGEVSESWLGAAIRDIALIPRAVTYPVMRAVTWDMDPATGKPLDPNDPAYKMAQFFDELLPETMQDSAKFAQASSVIGQLIPVGQGHALDKHANTGHWLRDLALSHSRGEMLNTDFGNMSGLQELQKKGMLPHWWDEATGFGLEIFMPGKIFTAPYKVGKTTLGTTSKALSSVARSAKADNVAEVFDAVRTWANSSESLGDALVLKRLQREVYEEAGIKLTKPVTIRGAVEAPDKVADMMAADLAARLMTVDKADDLRKVFAGVKEGSYLDQVINESFSTLVDFRNMTSTARSSKLFPKMVKDLGKYKRGRELLAEMRIAAKAKKMRPGIPDSVLAHRVIQGVMKNPIRRFTAEHIPDNFVFAGDSTIIVRKNVWLANQDKINKALSSKLAADIVLKPSKLGGKDAYLRFKNGKEVAALAMKEFQRSDYAPALVKAVDKVRKGEAITRDQYNVIRNLSANSIIVDELPSVALSVRDGTAMLSRKASLLGQGRDLTVHRYIERAVKGTRAFFGGKSDYSAMVINPGKKGAFRPHPTLFGQTAAPALAEWNIEVVARLNTAARKAETMLMEANKSADPITAMNKVLRRVGSGDETTDYINILNLFYGLDGGLEKWVGTNKKLRALIKAEGLPPVSIEGVKRAIAMVRRKVDPRDAARLEESVIKRKAWYGRLTGDDDLSALLSAHVTRNVTEEVYSKAVRSFENLYPGFLVKTPSAAQAAVRVELFKDIAKLNGIEPKLADEMAKVVAKSFKANDADRRSIATAIMGVMFKEGRLASQDDLMRMYEAAVDESVTGIIGRWKGGSITDMRDALKKFIDENPGSPTLMELERVMVPAYVKAVADIDMNDIRGIFAGLGVKGQAGERTLIGGALGPTKFGDNGLLFFDDRLAALAQKMGDVGITRKIENQLSGLRHLQRAKGQGVLDAWQTTRRTTITGILGGSVLPGTRFIGLNGLTNFLIAGITVPGYALNMAIKTPSAVGQAFVRAFRRAGGLSKPGAYNPYKMLYAGDEGTPIFTTVNGKIWTKQMLEEAAEKHSLRFSQVSFEFGSDTLQNAMRASKLGPKGQSVEGLLRIPGTKGVTRQRFWEFLRPDKKTVWTSVAEELDNVQRMSVFSEALRVGMKEADAAALARASLLDYANMGDGFVRKASKNMAFFAFRYNMAVETMLAFTRDGRALNNMAGTFNAINAQRKDMEEWVLEPDWMKTRLWNDYHSKFGEWVSGPTGPDVPFSDAFGMISSFFGFMMDSRYRESFSGAELVSEGFRGLLSDPRYQALFDIDALKGTGSSPHGYMPPAYLASASYFGMQDEVISLFNLERVPDSQTRPDIGFVNGQQYRFRDGDDSFHFKLFQLGALITGQNRALNDLPRSLAGLGIDPSNVDWRKERLAGPLFGLGGSVGSFRDAQAALAHIDNALYKELRDLGKRPTTDR